MKGSGEAGRDASGTDAGAPKGPFLIPVARRCYVEAPDRIFPEIGEVLRVSTIITNAFYEADGGVFERRPGWTDNRDVLTLSCLLKSKHCTIYGLGLAALDRGEPLEAYSMGSSDSETVSIRSATRFVIENVRDTGGKIIEVDLLAGQVKVTSKRSDKTREWRGEGTCENTPPPPLFP